MTTTIHQIGSISITILMDNSTDFLLTNSDHAIRPTLIKDEKFILPPPVAEHGFSALIEISGSDQCKGENNNRKKFLFDTGVSENGVIHNADIFGIEFRNIDGIILSHGHFDHFAGLINALDHHLLIVRYPLCRHFCSSLPKEMGSRS